MSRIIGQYQLVEFVNSGSFGDVYKCIDRSTGVEYACKIVALSTLQDVRSLNNFKNELIIHSKLSHPGVVQMCDIRVDNQFVYLFLEFSNCGSLEKAVGDMGGFEEQFAASVFKQIMEAIRYLHDNGVVHRDITLANILLSGDGSVKLSDFGLCRYQPENSYLSTFCGTFVYAPPEILKKEQYNGTKVDIWSAGVCLYAMISNHLPWSVDDAVPQEQIMEAVASQILSGEIVFENSHSVLLRDLLSNLLDLDPECRPDASSVLSHPWLDSAEGFGISEPPPPNEELISLVKQICEQL